MQLDNCTLFKEMFTFASKCLNAFDSNLQILVQNYLMRIYD